MEKVIKTQKKKSDGYHLYDLVQLFNVNQAQGSSGSGSLSNIDNVTIKFMAQGMHSGVRFFAAYTSNDYFIFWYMTGDDVPLVRTLRWYQNRPMLKMAAMTFSPRHPQSIVGISVNLTVVVIPIYFIMVRGEEATFEVRDPPKINPFTDISLPFATRFSADKKQQKKMDDGRQKIDIITSATKQRNSRITACLWWHSWDFEDYVIISSNSGNLRIVNLKSFAVWKIKTRQNVKTMELFEEENSYKYILLIGQNGVTSLLYLETNYNGRIESIITHGNSNRFQPKPVQKLGKDCVISKQQIKKNSSVIPLIGSYNNTTNQLMLFESHLQTKYPLYTIDLASTNFDHLHLTENSLFCFSNEPTGTVTVIPKFKSVGNKYSSKTSQILQDFQLPRGETILGTFVFNEERILSPLVDEGVRISFPEGCFFWTQKGLYEIRPKSLPQEIFFEMVNLGKDAELFGANYDLDLFHLYELAGDTLFELGNSGLALNMYYLSNIDDKKLSQKYIDIGKIEIVISRLRTQVSSSSYTKQMRAFVSNLLFKCYVQKILQNSFENEPEYEEFEEYIHINESYDTNLGLDICLQNGLIKYLIMVAKVRDTVGHAFFILSKSGYLRLSSSHIDYLKECDLLDHFKEAANGAFIRSLDVKDQLRVYLSDVLNISKYIFIIKNLIPELDEDDLLYLAKYFNPEGKKMKKLFTARRSLPSVDDGFSNSKNVVKEDFYELFFTISLALGYHRMEHVKSNRFSKIFDEKQKDALFSEESHDVNIQKINIGWNHGTAISEYGDVYVFGKNMDGQLGLDINEYSSNCIVIPHLRADSTSCGGKHTISLDYKGKLWSWGDGSKGQLGLGNYQSVTAPTLIPTLEKVEILAIFSGYNFNIAIASDSIYSWGENNRGQLGVGDTGKEDRCIPQKIKYLSGIKIGDISCGRNHTALLTRGGELYTWGDNSYGQLGHKGRNEKINQPKLVEYLMSNSIIVKKVTCGDFHTIAIDTDNNVYSWGDNDFGKLGYETEAEESQYIPKKIDPLKNTKIEFIGASANHSVAVTDKGEVLCWGDVSNFGNAKDFKQKKHYTSSDDSDFDATFSSSFEGNLDSDSYISNASIAILPITDILTSEILSLQCGSDSIFLLLGDGSIFSWGRNDDGKLGTGDTNHRSVPTCISIKSTKNTILNVSSDKNLSVVFNQDTLLKSINVFFGKYNPNKLIQICKLWKNWEAVAVIYEAMGEFSYSISARLNQISNMKFIHPHEETKILLYLLRYTVEELVVDDISKKSTLILTLFKNWKDKNLSANPLSTYIKNNVEILTPILGEVLATTENENPFFIEVDPEIYLDISHSYLAYLESEFQHTFGFSHENESRLLKSIKNNIVENVDKKEHIIIPTFNVTTRSSNSLQRDVAFTCGHFFPKEKFSSILATFRERTQAQIPNLHLTLTLIVNEYEQNSIALACPMCLYNYFAAHNGAETWEED